MWVPDTVTLAVLCIGCFCRGTIYVPMKSLCISDTVYFTLWKSIGVVLVGLLQWIVSGRPNFEPLAMLGGIFCATGSACIPIAIQCCGLGLGQLVSNTSSMLAGWAIGKFGLFGKAKEIISYPMLNFFGVVIAVVTFGLFMAMKEERPAEEEKSKSPTMRDYIRQSSGTSLVSENSRLTARAATKAEATANTLALPEEDVEEGRRLFCAAKEAQESFIFLAGMMLATAAGLMIGLRFSPVVYVQQIARAELAAGVPANQLSHSLEAMDYVFSCQVGALLTSVAYFAAYWQVVPRRPYMGNELIAPGLVSGVLAGTSQMAWFKVMDSVPFVIIFPIMIMIPALITCLWSTFYFTENQSPRARGLLLLAMTFQVIAVTLICLSKA